MRPRCEQPATERQIDYLRILGPEFDASTITKAEASNLIDERLAMGEPASSRQMVVLRFWDQVALADQGRRTVSDWMDEWYEKDPNHLEAWEQWKRDNGDDGSQGDPTRVPIGAGRRYLQQIGNSDSARIQRSDADGSLFARVGCLAMLGLGVWAVIKYFM